MSRITFNIAAKCDKAGRAQNQDNYWVCPNLDDIHNTSTVGNDSDVELSFKGALLVVADGMGGMKSGEKASEFVIEGIKAKFRNIPNDILGDDNSITSFIKNAIIEADQSIKEYAKAHRESEGMGSTIVLLWLLGEKAYCGWCGDSRIYCYNPQNSLTRLSHDHSYVQSLVDEGKITEEEAFDHPDGNIITRSLGDSGEKANPETKIYPIHRRDVFLLCSDGLCGLLDEEKISSILADNCTSSKDALAALWKEGEREGWSDNATIEVACITEGGVTPTRKATGYDEGKPKPTPITKSKEKEVKKGANVLPNFWQNNKNYILIVSIVAIIALGIIWLFSRDKKIVGSSNQEFNVEQPVNIGTDEPVVSEPEQPESPNNNQTPVKPTKTNTPNKPARPSHGQIPALPVQPQQPSEQQQPLEQQQPIKAVSPDYMNLLINTKKSIDNMKDTYTRAINSELITKSEDDELHAFESNYNQLDNLPDKKFLDETNKSILDEIISAYNNYVRPAMRYRVVNGPLRRNSRQNDEGRDVNEQSNTLSRSEYTI